MKTISRTATFNAPAEKVFICLDDLGVTGMHMSSSSSMMMGNKLQLQFLTRHHIGLGTRYRWTGPMMCLEMDFTVEVTKWIVGVEKVWETIGEARVIIDEHFRIIDFLISYLNKKCSAVSRLFSEVEVITI